MKTCLALFLSVGSLFGQTMVPVKFEAWPVPLEQRVFAGTFQRGDQSGALVLTGCRNEYVSAQLACRSPQEGTLQATVDPFSGPGGAAIPSDAVQVRFAAFLPVDENGQFTADPLLEEAAVSLHANLVQPVWLTVHVPKTQAPGLYRTAVRLGDGTQTVEVPLELEILQATLPDPPDYQFYLNLWQDPNGIARAHQVGLWSEPHWELLKRYALNLAAHGEKAITVSLIHDPWNSQTGYEFPSMVEWRHAGEWTSVELADFRWDFSVMDRYVNTYRDAGIRTKIEMFAMVKGPGPTTDASLRYFDTTAKVYRNRKLQAGEPAWEVAWAAFLPALRGHLIERGWWDIAYLGFDEKPGAVMERLIQFLAKAGPDYKLVTSGGHSAERAGQEVVLYWDQLLDSEQWEKRLAPMVEQLKEKGRMASFYTACEPRFPNLFLYSTLREARMLPWFAWKYKLAGYLRWAVHAYPEDVWSQPNFKWHSGDMYLTYPGKDGPLDGMRYEVFRQGIQDFEALRIAHEMASFWGRDDLVKILDAAVEKATILDSCRTIPLVEEARKLVNDVLREAGSPDEMGKKR